MILNSIMNIIYKLVGRPWFAPSYANIFMANWEKSALTKSPLKPLHYDRFLDDIWGIWTYSRADFENFIGILNTHHPTIKVKYTVDDNSVNFLDVTTFKGTNFTTTGLLDFKVDFKERVTHALLWKNSYHPQHAFQGLIRSQLLRFHKICSQKQDFKEATLTLFRALRHREYSRSFLRNTLKTFLNPKLGDEENKQKMIPLITTYSKQSLCLTHILRKNYVKFLGNTMTLQKHKIISAYHKNHKLQDLLVHSKLKPIRNTSEKPCLEYKHITFLTNLQSKMVNKLCPPISPKTKNCIYLIHCSKCNMKYVGGLGLK